jgi:hypothetical protein
MARARTRWLAIWTAGAERLAVAVVLLAGLAGSAHAQSVALDMTACVTPTPEDVRRLLRLELRDRLLALDAAPAPDTQQVEVRCTEHEAHIALAPDAETRRLALGSVPLEHRARLLALSIAELLQRPEARGAATTGAGKAATPAAARPAPVRDVPKLMESRAPASELLPRYALWVGAEVGVTPLWAFGASLQFRARLLRMFAWTGAYGFTQGKLAIDRGDLEVQSNALRTGPAFLVERARGSFHAGLGARLGFLRLRGKPDDAALTGGTQFRTWYVAPAVFAGGLVRLGRYALLGLELELTHTLRRVRADVEGGGARTLGALRVAGVLGAGATW